MKLKFNGFLVLLLVLVAQLTFAQERAVSGIVSDNAGMPLPGVSVLVKGTKSGTQTDFDGKFTIKASSSQILVFSYIGMKTQEVAASSTSLNVKLAAAAQELEGVVVTTALGIKREKKSLGYSAQTVSAEQVGTVPTGNFTNNLSGKVAGLSVTQGTNFGGSTNVVLRGFKSLLGDNQALFVVDGVPILNNNVNSLDQKSGRGGYDYGNAASDINPNNIAEINVLKGAAATALYGSRAQNGAIIITTKKGKARTDLSVEFSSSYTMSTVDRTTFPKYQQEYGEGYFGQRFSTYNGQPRSRSGDDASYGPKYDGSLVWQYDAFIPGSPNYGKQTPWKVAENGPIEFFDTGTSTINNISLNGGSEKATYRLTYANTDSRDILPNSLLSKNNFNFAGTYKFNDKLSSSFNATYVSQNTRNRNSTGYGGNQLAGFRQWWATNVDLNEQKDLYFQSRQNYTWNIKSAADITPAYWDNPYFQRYENYNNDSRQRVAANASITYDVNKNLSFTGRVGTDGFNLKTEDRIAPGSTPATLGSNANLQNLPAQPSGYALDLYNYSEQNYDFLATYKKDLTEDLNLSVLLGTNYNVQSKFSNQQMTSGGLYIPGLYTISNSVSAPALPRIVDTRKEVLGLFAQATLGYKGTYYLEGSVRRDQSSALPVDNNAYWYSAISGSVVFSNWLKDVEFINFGKFRVAYAQVGSDTDPNQLLDNYTARTPFGTPVYSFNTTAKNPNLKPQQLDNVELGLNMQFAQNRLGFDVAWFQNKAYDQILPLPVSTATGSNFNTVNAGTLTTKGFEVTLTGTPVKTDNFSWDVSVNWSNPNTKVTELAPGIENIQINTLQGGVSINAPLNQDYGQIWGTTYVLDASGNRIIGSNGAYEVSTTTDNKLGTYQADWIGGINNKFNYKNISFSFLIDMKKGGSVFSLDQYYGYGTGIYANSVGNNDLGNPIRNTLPNGGGEVLQGVMANPAYTPGGTQPQYITNTTRLDRSQSSQVLGTDPPAAAFVYDAGFVKLREVVLTYNLPSSILGSTIKGASFSVIGNNLWIIDKSLPYSDPEAGLSSGNTQGYQSGPMPTTRNISFNVKVNF
ncbi:SusC/RagA family TonB-linked outer membrane protein [Flavobacterium sp. LC2016-01]|uniref:SusC/RagA family TonB-linked outer membrane protein n=1 Tax=Flavobacterium sp. LC2016-01 TaxID=2675876 RepID=UPI0012BAFEEE|nr:SusC/RagA family TonB-linked outer membrane protein [Flavobacterium sp. LC2016-01]MTH17449.1 SusC/RagA family TonB-linked outer membrane protein [Flavobacterium sp. LC2016-01]